MQSTINSSNDKTIESRSWFTSQNWKIKRLKYGRRGSSVLDEPRSVTTHNNRVDTLKQMRRFPFTPVKAFKRNSDWVTLQTMTYKLTLFEAGNLCLFFSYQCQNICRWPKALYTRECTQKHGMMMKWIHLNDRICQCLHCIRVINS